MPIQDTISSAHSSFAALPDSLSTIGADSTAGSDLQIESTDTTANMSLREGIAEGWLPRFATAADSLDLPNTVSLGEMFGSECYIAHTPRQSQTSDRSITSTSAFEVAAVVMLIAYMVVAAMFRHEVPVLFKSFRISSSPQKADEESGVFFSLFLNLLIVVGAVLLTLVSFKTIDMTGFELTDRLIDNAVWVVPAMAVVLLLIYIVQTLLLRHLGVLFAQRQMIDELIFLRRLSCCVGVMLLTPLAALTVLNGSASAKVLAATIAIVILILILQYLARSYLLFARKKVSILLWILYLCSVEIIPVGTLFALLLQNS